MVSLITIHFISDFLLQRRKVAESKSSSWLALFEHVIIIFFCFLPFGFLFSLTNAAIHGAIDRFIWNIYKFIRKNEGKGFEYWKDDLFYKTIGFDQMLHLLTLVILKGYFNV